MPENPPLKPECATIARGHLGGLIIMKSARPFLAAFCLILLASPFLYPANAQHVVPPPYPGPAHISLNGTWKLYYFPQGKFQITNPEQLKAHGLTPMEAMVPGETALDLSRQGVLPADLFFGENIKKLKPYELYEWWYQREFATPAGMAGRRLELRFHGVDCLATYWLNGKKLGESAGLHD